MYRKAMPTLSCVTRRVFHRLALNLNNENVDGKRNLFGAVFIKSESNTALSVTSFSNFLLKRRVSLCKSHLVVDYRVRFYSNSFHSLNLEFLKSNMRTGRCSSFVSNARGMFVTSSERKMAGVSFVSHPILKPRSGWSPGCCCFYSTTADGQGKPKDELLDLELMAKKMLESAKKRDVMAGSVPLRKAVALLEVLHRQGFVLDGMTNILGQQLPFLLDPESLTSLTELLLSHGFRHNSVILFLGNLPVLEKNTSLKHLKNLVDDSISFLRITGFEESDIRSFLTLEPRIFFTDRKVLNSVISQLNGLFSVKDSLYVIKNSPNVFMDPWDETRKKFDYVYFVMGYKQPAMLKSSLFEHSHSYIVDRHQFLLRAGFFHSVSEKDDPKLNPNPPLSDVLDTPNGVFAKKFGGFLPEEYTAYLNMRDVEREEEDDDISSTSDEEDEIEEEEDKTRNKTKDKPLKKKKGRQEKS